MFQREIYPHGFFVVLVVKGDDADCNGLSDSKLDRTKKITLVINPTISKHDYVIATASVTTIAVLFCISYITTTIIFNIKKNRKLKRLEMINDQNEDVDEQVPSTSSVTIEVMENVIETKIYINNHYLKNLF